MSIRIAVVGVYDPATGWSTQPVAAVGWRPGWTWWDWVPMSEPARRLRYDIIESLEPEQRESWLQQFLDEPTVTYSVNEVDVAPDITAAEQAVQATLDALLVAGA
jgi:hypothetical protein